MLKYTLEMVPPNFVWIPTKHLPTALNGVRYNLELASNADIYMDEKTGNVIAIKWTEGIDTHVRPEFHPDYSPGEPDNGIGNR